MKICLVFTALAAVLPAQTPPPVTPETVVAKIDGKDLTVGDLRQMLQSYPPAFMQDFQRDPRRALQDIFMVRYASAEGDKLKLGEQTEWKQQIEIARMNIVAAAMYNHERNFYPVSIEDINNYYARNQARYEQAAIKIIKIAFKPGSAAGETKKSVEQLAQEAFQSAHAASDRSEADARKLAADLVKKLREGADFAQLVTQYSDDAESKASGGDFGTVKPSSGYADDFKKAVLALKPGQVSDPIAAGPALYIVRVEKKTVLPMDDVRVQIIDEIKDTHFKEYFQRLQTRFAPQLIRPDLLVQMNATAGK
ncbi:MAG TPA: peptidylprolyl isomerase [Bryobacteraceae bacterium]|jgi:parvulin-like peptidyl-prolyl isomerase|nr:peptidylprolyl isomerase [Bryobacteraceae bacterium]